MRTLLQSLPALILAVALAPAATAAVSVSGPEVIINSSGEGGHADSLFDGEIQATESGFFIFVSGEWKQTGANSGTESIWTFADDYTPKITGSGSNNVKCTYEQVGWFIGYGGPTVSDDIDFSTLPEVQNKTFTPLADYTLNSAPKTAYTSPIAGTVTVGISGTVQTAWSESATNAYSTEISGSINGSSTVGGKVTIKSIAELSGTSTSGWSTSIKQTITSSYTSQTSGSSSTTVSFSQQIPVQAGQTILITEVTKCQDARVEVFFLPDANKDGLADNGAATDTAVARLRSAPYLNYVASIQ